MSKTINRERSRSNPVPFAKNSKVIMKRALIFLLTMYAVVTAADELKVSQPAPSEVIHVATALDHLTVLEFGEPVTMAAAGSPAFQIERHEDKDRKSTRLNSSHSSISYAVFCLKKKK